MSKAPVFNPPVNFNELSQIKGSDLDATFAVVKASIDALAANLKSIQRDDTKLANNSVHARALSSEATALINATFDYTGVFETGRAYTAGQSYDTGKTLYLVLIAHTGTSVITDRSLGYVIAVTTDKTGGISDFILTNQLTGSSNNFLLTLNKGNYEDGETYALIPNHTNTGAATINRDAKGAKPILINGREARAGELVSERKTLVGYSEAKDSWELLSDIPVVDTLSQAKGVNVLVSSDTQFSVEVDAAVFVNAAGEFAQVGVKTKVISIASAAMNGSYSYGNDAWYDIYLLTNNADSFEVELVPNGSPVVPNSSHPFSVRAGCLYNSGGNLLRSSQNGFGFRFLQDVVERASSVLSSASGLVAVTLTLPSEVKHAEVSMQGQISGTTSSTLNLAQGAGLQLTPVFTLTAGCTDQSVVRTVYAREDGNDKKIDIEYTAGTANTLRVGLCGFVWR